MEMRITVLDWRLFGHKFLCIRLWRGIDQWNNVNGEACWTRKNGETAGLHILH